MLRNYTLVTNDVELAKLCDRKEMGSGEKGGGVDGRRHQLWVEALLGDSLLYPNKHRIIVCSFLEFHCLASRLLIVISPPTLCSL